MKISKTAIRKRLLRKANPELRKVLTALLTTKAKSWLRVAWLLSRPTRRQVKVNLNKLEKVTKPAETVVIPGKLLAAGKLTHPLKAVVAFSASEAARKKLPQNTAFENLAAYVKKNPTGKRIRIVI